MVTVYIKNLLLSGLTKVSYDFITSIFEHKILAENHAIFYIQAQ
ncbi:MAG: hypothetical protein ACI848_001507 [Roseivirga sp.]|jgi:hypothetical protein